MIRFHLTLLAITLIAAPAVSAKIIADQCADLVLGRKFGHRDGFSAPSGIAVDPMSHKVFISDAARHRVLRFSSPASMINGSPAEAVLGQLDFTGDSPGNTFDASVALDQMNTPGPLFCDTGGRLWVCDTLNRRVLRFDNAASIGSGRRATRYFGDGGVEVDANSIGEPAGVVLDSTGHLYVSDSRNHRIMRWNNAVGLGSGVIASAVFGQPGLTAGGMSSNGSAATELYSPRGLAIDAPGNLWVADYSNNRVLRFASPGTMASGAPATAQIGQPDFGFSAQPPLVEAWRIYHPVSVALDPAGTLYVAAETDERVLRYADAAFKSGAVDANSVLGAVDLTSDGGFGFTANVFRPTQITTDGASHLWVGDIRNKRVIRFGLATGAGGRLWVSDYENQRVLRFDNAAAKPNGAPANGVLGQTDFVSEGTELDANSFEGPLGLFEDAAGQLWVADSRHNRVLGWANAAAAANGVSATWLVGQTQYFTAAGGSLGRPSGVAVDAAGRLYVANSSRNSVVWFEGAGQTLAARPTPDGGVGRWSQAFNAIGTSTDRFEFPVSVALDKNGSLYVSDNRNTRVMRFLNFTPEIIDADIAGGQFRFTFTCVPEQKYDIYRSENLGPWTMESTVTGPAGVNSLLYTSSMAVSGARRQYRVAVP